MSGEDRYGELIKSYHPTLVGRRIRRIRLLNELSQSAMARLLVVRPNTISQIEGGHSRPAPDVETRIKALFRVTVDWVRYGDPSGLPAQLALGLDKVEAEKPAEKLAPDPRVHGRKLSRPARSGPKKRD